MKGKFLFSILASVVCMLPSACSNNKVSKETTTSIVEPKDPIEWVKTSYKDEFGKSTGEVFEAACLKGKFSNSVTSNSNLEVYIAATKDGRVIFALAEYGRIPVKNKKVYMAARNTEGKVERFHLEFDEDGLSEIDWLHREQEVSFNNFMKQNGEIEISMREIDAYGVPSEYVFSIPDGASVRRAIERLNK